MTDTARAIDTCPFRWIPADDPETAYCRLVQELSGVRDTTLSAVSRAACEACCRTFIPSADEFNPVVAGLLYQLSVQVLARGGVPGCDVQQAGDLRQLAESNLPWEADASSPGEFAEAPSAALAQLIPTPAIRCGPAIRNWSVGVTTAPRQSPTLERCLASLSHAGWQTPRVFVDGELTVPTAWSHLPRTNREPQIGAWPNYYLALAELLMRDPAADAYLVVQDDALFCSDPCTREYLEQVFWPGESAGIASLFCSRADTQPVAGWYQYPGAWSWCALAFVFSRAAAQRFLADLDVVRHRESRRKNGLAHISWCIGQWAVRSQVPVYFPTPSLVQHIGEVSTLWSGARVWGNRRAGWFAG